MAKNDIRDRQHELFPPNQEGLWLLVFIACYAALLGAWAVRGWVALIAAVVILAIAVLSFILQGRAGASASILWFIFVLTSALVLSSAFHEHYALPLWPERLASTFLVSLGVGAAIAMYPRYIAPRIRSRQQARSRSHDNH